MKKRMVVMLVPYCVFLVWMALQTPETLNRSRVFLSEMLLWLLPASLFFGVLWGLLATIHRFRNRRR